MHLGLQAAVMSAGVRGGLDFASGGPWNQKWEGG